MDTASKAILSAVCNQPTTTFHEFAVATVVRWYAAGLDLPVEEDEAGNLVVQYSGGRTRKGQGVTFIAHMDHPGFEVIAVKGKRATVVLYGRVDAKIVGGARIVIQGEAGPVKGQVGRRALTRTHMGRPCFSITMREPVPVGAFGHFDLPGLRLAKDRIHARAADDLVNVAALLDLLTRLKRKRVRANVTAIFTRAEEVGFIGTYAAIEAKTISRQQPVIVLECSSAKAGRVDIGGGPVIRAGDRAGTYTPAVDAWMATVAEHLIHSGHGSRVTAHGFRFQRALLAGGRCEACALTAEGFPTGGIALPLGNYHNQGPRGPAAEFVSASDYDHLLVLITALARSPMPKDILKANAKPLWKNYRGWKRKLIATT